MQANETPKQKCIPKVSIIIPVYQGEGTIKRCLDSIYNQRFKDFEVIIVNDGSTDATQCILEEYKAKFEQMQLIVQENRGTAAARTVGIKSARGSYLYIADADDWMHPRLLELSYSKASEKSLDIVYFNHFDCYDELFYPVYNHQDRVFRVPSHCLYIQLIKRSFLEKVPLDEIPKITYNEDWLINILMSFHSPNIEKINHFLYYYDKDSSTLSSFLKNRYSEDLRQAYEFLKAYILKEHLSLEYLKDLKKWALQESGYWKGQLHRTTPKLREELTIFYEEVLKT